MNEHMGATILSACVAVAAACATGPTTDTAVPTAPAARRDLHAAAAPPASGSTEPPSARPPEAATAAPMAPTADPSTTPAIVPTAGPTSVASTQPPDCGFVPAPSEPLSSVRAARPWNAGCGLAADPQSPVVTMNVVEVDMGADPTVVRFVLLDAANRRVVPAAVPVRYDLVLVPRATGMRRLGAAHHRDGVFELKVPGRRRIGSPCNWWVRLHYEPSTGPRLQDEIDDWLHGC